VLRLRLRGWWYGWQCVRYDYADTLRKVSSEVPKER